MSFSHQPPPLPSPATTSPIQPILTTLLSPLPVPPHLIHLADTLLATRVAKTVKREMYELSGALRDEWKVRVGAVKADWMARVIPSAELNEEDEGEGEREGEPAEGENGEGPGLVPTILSDFDGREEMVVRVDRAVEAEFEARVAEAEERIRAAAARKELMEVELLLGEAVSSAALSESSFACSG